MNVAPKSAVAPITTEITYPPEVKSFIRDKISKMTTLMQKAFTKFEKGQIEKAQAKLKIAREIYPSEEKWNDFDRLLLGMLPTKESTIRNLNVPSANKEFYERQGLNLEHFFSDTNLIILTQPPEIACKTGKTELAKEYARNFNGTSLWIDYKQGIEIPSGFRKVGINSLEDLLNWIAENPKGLLVLNDIPSLEAAKNFLSGKILGQVLVITRNCNIEIVEKAKIIQVGLFTPKDSKNFLQEKTNCFQDGPAETLARQLGHVPSRMVEIGDRILKADATIAGFNLRNYRTATIEELKNKGNVPVHQEFLLRPIAVQALKEMLDARATYDLVVLFSEEAGVGKKWIAHESVLERIEQYDLIWRFPCCQNAEIFWHFYSLLAKKLGISDVDQAKEKLIAEVKEKLTTKRFVIILEDAQNDQCLADFFPQKNDAYNNVAQNKSGPNSKIPKNNSVYVIITRNQEWAQSRENALLIRSPAKDLSLDYLTNKLKKTPLALEELPQKLFHHPLLIQTFCYCLASNAEAWKVVQPLLEKATSARELFCLFWDTAFKDQEKKLPAFVLSGKSILDPLVRFCLKQNGIIESHTIYSWASEEKLNLPDIELCMLPRISLLVNFQILIPFVEGKQYIVNPIAKSWLDSRDTLGFEK